MNKIKLFVDERMIVHVFSLLRLQFSVWPLDGSRSVWWLQGVLCGQLRNLLWLQHCPVSADFWLFPPLCWYHICRYESLRTTMSRSILWSGAFAPQWDQSASQQWKVKFRFQFLLSLNSEALTLVETRKQEAWFHQSCIIDCRLE